jgi:hypothetical protein
MVFSHGDRFHDSGQRFSADDHRSFDHRFFDLINKEFNDLTNGSEGRISEPAVLRRQTRKATAPTHRRVSPATSRLLSRDLWKREKGGTAQRPSLPVFKLLIGR